MLEILLRLAANLLVEIAVFEKRNKIDCNISYYKGGIIGKDLFKILVAAVIEQEVPESLGIFAESLGIFCLILFYYSGRG